MKMVHCQIKISMAFHVGLCLCFIVNKYSRKSRFSHTWILCTVLVIREYLISEGTSWYVGLETSTIARKNNNNKCRNKCCQCVVHMLPLRINLLISHIWQNVCYQGKKVCSAGKTHTTTSRIILSACKCVNLTHQPTFLWGQCPSKGSPQGTHSNSRRVPRDISYILPAHVKMVCVLNSQYTWNQPPPTQWGGSTGFTVIAYAACKAVKLDV